MQLQKLVPVVKVVDYQDVAYVERDLMLAQISTSADGDAGGNDSSSRRSELLELATRMQHDGFEDLVARPEVAEEAGLAHAEFTRDLSRGDAIDRGVGEQFERAIDDLAAPGFSREALGHLAP